MIKNLAIGTAILSLSSPVNQAYPVKERADKKPNILIILADDLGYGDVQSYNPDRGRIPTPNIDRLALQGMRFTDGHSSSGVCSPSRYTLLTGRYLWRTRLPDDAGEDSFSFLPLLQGKDKPVREHAMNCALEGTPALRAGQWKLILGPASVWFSKIPDDNTVKLYNLAVDPGETKNLVAEHPKRAARMKAQLEMLIANGRSTPGKVQKNDVEVNRYSDTEK